MYFIAHYPVTFVTIFGNIYTLYTYCIDKDLNYEYVLENPKVYSSG